MAHFRKIGAAPEHPRKCGPDPIPRPWDRVQRYPIIRRSALLRLRISRTVAVRIQCILFDITALKSFECETFDPGPADLNKSFASCSTRDCLGPLTWREL